MALDPARLQELVDWMRKNGVVRLVDGSVEVELAPMAAPAAEAQQRTPPVSLTPVDRKREKYRRELGVTFDDDALARLP